MAALVPPPESGPEAVAQAALWRISARERFVREGAEVLVEIGGSVVFALDPTDVSRALEICLALADAFEPDATESGGVAFALTLGPLERAHAQGAYLGDALDRAQALANKVSGGEIVLDVEAQAAASASYLFARELSDGSGLHGEIIDRACPRRSDCSRALSHLSKPHLPTTAQAQLSSLHKLAASSGRHRVLLVGPYGSGASAWLTRIADEVAPPLWLDVRALATALAPLSGLMYALRRLPEAVAPERLLDSAHEADRNALSTLRGIREGRASSRRDAINALRQYMGRCQERTGKRGWISVNPTTLVDPASVGVVAEVARDGGPESLLLMRLPPDAKAPDTFARTVGLAEIRVPGLSQQDARSFAQSMLGRETAQDIARRAAAMGGNTPLGVAEAVRVLITSGDVVFDGNKFHWRRGPAGRVTTLSVDSLLEERIDQVDPDARRLLEALAIVPDPDEIELVNEVADADGLPARTRSGLLDELIALSLVKRSARGIALSVPVRGVIEGALPPARLAELNRFVAHGLERRIPSDDAFARGTLAFYLARGGKPHEAVDLLLEVAITAGQLGFVRSGVRLAAAAVECDPSDDTRNKAASIAERLSARAASPKRPPPEQPPPLRDGQSEPALPLAPDPVARPLSAQALQQAVNAILARDFDAVDRALELVVAAGKDGPSVDRLRAIALLVRGDRAGAMRLLDRARQREGSNAADTPKTALATALVLLETGESGMAVRETLRALGWAREQQDGHGERAALKTMALCYRRLGRELDAEALDAAAARAALPADDLSGSSPG